MLFLGTMVAEDGDWTERIRWEPVQPACQDVRALFDEDTWELTLITTQEHAVFSLPKLQGWYRFTWREHGEHAVLNNGQTYKRRA